MASPVSAGSASPAAPDAPDEVVEAAVADPGEMAEIQAERIQLQQVQIGSVEVGAITRNEEEEPPAEEPVKVWVEFKVLDAAGEPIDGERCNLVMSDGTEKEVSTAGGGVIREENVDPGSVRIHLLDRRDNEWKKTGTENPDESGTDSSGTAG